MLEKVAAGESNTPILAGGKAVIDKTSKLFEMCQEFETFLLKNLISSMRDTVQKSELLDTGFAGKVYEDMLYDEYTKDFAKNAGFGFAEMAYLELTGQRGKTLAQNPKI
jgi:flagellar protein FlgJ